MKYRNKKAIATLIVTTLIFTCGATGVQAAPAADLNIVGNVAAAPISGVSLAVAQANTQTAAEQAALVQNMGVAQIDNYLNVRSEASTDSEVVGIMKNNAVAEITGAVDGWYQITSGSVSGYVKAEYLAVGNQDLLNSVKTRMAQVNTETLKVREEPNTDSTVITLIPQEEELEVVDVMDNGWIKFLLDDEEAYVSGDYVDVEERLEKAVSITELLYGQGVSDAKVSLVQYAKQFIGNPYVWGGTSLTSGADCSGFTMSVFKKYGISLPHHAASQSQMGTKVSLADAQPGDLVFYAKNGKINHVAIYIGGGQVVHASSPKTGIKISSVNYRTP